MSNFHSYYASASDLNKIYMAVRSLERELERSKNKIEKLENEIKTLKSLTNPINKYD